MTATTTPARPVPSRTRSALRFAGHYLEMVVAMMIGMVVLAPVWRLAWPGLADRPDLETIVMAFDMTIAMAAWMRLRRHPWPHITRMCVAMDLGFVLVLPAYWLGALSAEAMMGLGHVLMLVLMLVAMLRDPHPAHRSGS
jgi:flagellar biosynthetic protein FliP